MTSENIVTVQRGRGTWQGPESKAPRAPVPFCNDAAQIAALGGDIGIPISGDLISRIAQRMVRAKVLGDSIRLCDFMEMPDVEDAQSLGALKAGESYHPISDIRGDQIDFCYEVILTRALTMAIRSGEGDLISREAEKHALALEQCAIFAADAGQHIARAMTDAAAFLRALPAQGQPATPPVKVKPLVWVDCTDGTSHDIGCQYEIEKDGKFWRVCRAATGGGSYVCHADNLRSAKAGAQAYHEARILSALEGAQ